MEDSLAVFESSDVPCKGEIPTPKVGKPREGGGHVS